MAELLNRGKTAQALQKLEKALGKLEIPSAVIGYVTEKQTHALILSDE